MIHACVDFVGTITIEVRILTAFAKTLVWDTHENVVYREYYVPCTNSSYYRVFVTSGRYYPFPRHKLPTLSRL